MAYFKYKQVADRLIGQIKENIYLPGDRIPTEEELCAEFQVGRQTLRSAVSLLEEAGILRRVQGSGTYVCEQEDSGAGEAVSAESAVPTDNPGSIALVMMNSQDYIFLNVMRGISDRLAEKGYVLNTIVTDGNYEKERLALENLLRNPPAGILLEPVCSGILSVNAPLLREISEKIPCLLIHANETELFPAVQLGDREGIRRATEYLISVGHRRIGTIFGFDEVTGQNRYLGYMEALRANGIPQDAGINLWTQYCRKEELFESGGCQVLDRMLAGVTAVICHDDRLAFRLIQYLEEKGIRVPADISVVGYDNSDYSVTGLPITTVAHPKVKYGELAAEALLELIRTPDKADPTQYQVEPELVIRSSTAPPRSELQE